MPCKPMLCHAVLWQQTDLQITVLCTCLLCAAGLPVHPGTTSTQYHPSMSASTNLMHIFDDPATLQCMLGSARRAT